MTVLKAMALTGSRTALRMSRNTVSPATAPSTNRSPAREPQPPSGRESPKVRAMTPATARSTPTTARFPIRSRKSNHAATAMVAGVMLVRIPACVALVSLSPWSRQALNTTTPPRAWIPATSQVRPESRENIPSRRRCKTKISGNARRNRSSWERATGISATRILPATAELPTMTMAPAKLRYAPRSPAFFCPIYPPSGHVRIRAEYAAKRFSGLERSCDSGPGSRPRCA